MNKRSKQFNSLLASLVLGLVLFGAGSMTPANADLIDFDFSFTNSANDGGTVTGIVRGLMDDATSSAASVEVLSNSTGFGIGEYVGSPSDNIWVVAAGMLVEFDFLAFGSSNSSPDVFDSSL